MSKIAYINEFSIEAVRDALQKLDDFKKLIVNGLTAFELNELENEMRGIKNYNIAVKKHGDDITFLRRIIRGGADDSLSLIHI